MKQDALIVHVVAMTELGVIGNKGQMPWHLPSDLRFFRKLTLDKPVIMGRKTFQSIGCKPLSGRDNIVITGNAGFSADGVTVVNSRDEAVRVSQVSARQMGSDEIAVVGGGLIYQLTMPITDRLHLTIIKDSKKIMGDVYYPYIPLEGTYLPEDQWKEVHREDISRVGEEQYDRIYIMADRKK